MTHRPIMPLNSEILSTTPEEDLAVANMIIKGTQEIKNEKLNQLIIDHSGHLAQYGVEAPEVLQERSRLQEAQQRQVKDKSSLDNVMEVIQLTNDVDSKILEFTDQTTQFAFKSCLKEFGEEKTMKALKMYDNNPIQTLARLRGYPDVMTMTQERQQDKKDFIESLKK